MASLTVLALLLTAGVALAQTDIRVHGHQITFAGGTLTLRGDDGYTYSVTVGRTHSPLLGKVGQGLTVVGQRGAQPHTITATQIIQDQPTAAWGQGPNRAWQTTRGRIVSVTGSTMAFDHGLGNVLSVDVSPILGQLQLKLGESGVLLFEKAPNGRYVAVWVFEPAATPLATQTPAVAAAPAAAATPARPATGDVGRIEGHVLDVTDHHVIVHTNEGRFHRIHLGAIAPNVRAGLERGQRVVVDGQRDPNAQHQFFASSISPQAARKRYITASGTVESISGNSLTLRKADGRVVSYDLSEMPRWQKRSMDKGGAVTLVHEPDREQTVLWLDTTPQPAASPGR